MEFKNLRRYRATARPARFPKAYRFVTPGRLRWKEHVQQAIKHATRVAVALAGLRILRLEQMRQIYQACITPIVGYASTVWHDPLRDKTHLRHLNTVQRAPLIRTLSAFRTVALTTLEVEAHILPTSLYLAIGYNRLLRDSTPYLEDTLSGVRSYELRNGGTTSGATLASD